MPSDDETVRVPFLFVPHGEMPSAAWLAGHPDAVKIPASFVPRGSGRVTRGGAPWPMSASGRPWPPDRYGSPYRPLWEYGPGERVPGAAMPAGSPPVPDADAAIGAYLDNEAYLHTIIGGEAVPAAGGDASATIEVEDALADATRTQARPTETAPGQQ